MMPKSILIVATSSVEESVFAAAEGLGKRWDAHVTSLQVTQLPDSVQAAAGYTSSVWAELLSETRKYAAEERIKIAKRLTAFECITEAREVEGTIADLEKAVAMYALHADLTIVERPSNTTASVAFEAALFRSGRPVLLTPPQWRGGAIGANVMVAWSAKRESARALADAAPFLKTARTVNVVAVDASPAYVGDTFAGYDISAHLARHGLKVALRQIDSFGRTAEGALLDEARDLDVDLIVMGGYGHSRMREFMLGGVTRGLTQHAPVPLLLSH
jgi:nucleotide-binding universal stress UspA family protein